MTNGHPISAVNAAILAQRLAEFDAVQGPRVGDFIRLPRKHRHHVEYTRITHDWGDTVQTGGTAGGSYYLYGPGLSYSGSLDRGICKAQLIPTGEAREGSVWFFNEGISGAGRGKYFSVPMRVFAIREGADLSGLDELRCPYSLTCLNEEQHKETCGYWFTVRHRGMAHTAFRTVEELREWLSANDLVLGGPLPATPKTFACVALKYSEEGQS